MNQPPPPGYYRAAAFVYNIGYGEGHDYHWIVEHPDGTWTGKSGTAPEVNETTLKDQINKKTLVAVYCIKGTAPANPIAIFRKLQEISCLIHGFSAQNARNVAMQETNTDGAADLIAQLHL